MNREIASAPEKSVASFCARRTAAVWRPSGRTMRKFSCLVVGTCVWSGRRKRQKTAWRLGAHALNALASLIVKSWNHYSSRNILNCFKSLCLWSNIKKTIETHWNNCKSNVIFKYLIFASSSNCVSPTYACTRFSLLVAVGRAPLPTNERSERMRMHFIRCVVRVALSRDTF